MAALSLSVNNAIPFAGIWASGLLKKSYACLYGVETRKSYLIDNIPNGLLA